MLVLIREMESLFSFVTPFCGDIKWDECCLLVLLITKLNLSVDKCLVCDAF